MKLSLMGEAEEKVEKTAVASGSRFSFSGANGNNLKPEK